MGWEIWIQKKKYDNWFNSQIIMQKGEEIVLKEIILVTLAAISFVTSILLGNVLSILIWGSFLLQLIWLKKIKNFKIKVRDQFEKNCINYNTERRRDCYEKYYLGYIICHCINDSTTILYWFIFTHWNIFLTLIN